MVGGIQIMCDEWDLDALECACAVQQSLRFSAGLWGPNIWSFDTSDSVRTHSLYTTAECYQYSQFLELRQK